MTKYIQIWNQNDGDGLTLKSADGYMGQGHETVAALLPGFAINW